MTPFPTRIGFWCYMATALLVGWLPLTVRGQVPGPAFEVVENWTEIPFRFQTGSRNRHDLPEIMGGGVALFDADGDGWLDIYACNGGPIDPNADGASDPPSRLFRNLGGWRFEDITDRAQAPGPSYAMGAVVGDIDGDGRDDLLVTGWRDLRLYHNRGAGRFEDITGHSGLNREGWSTSAVFADWDDDGDLDLFVGRYLDYDPATAPFCAAPDGRRDYCGPEVFPAQADRLYRNVGQCRFEDVSAESGIALPGGRALGVLAADLTGDRRLDLFVANDGSACRLFENRGDFRFRDVGMEAGVAFDGGGKPLSAMGVALGDVDGDGQADLMVTNFLGRSTVGFRGLGRGLFADASEELGLRAFTADVLGFGLALEDFDADGDLDLIQANGHVLDRARLGEPLAMRAKALRNVGGRFQNASDQAGPGFRRPMLGRGLATGDLDRDGRPDAVVAALDAPMVVLRNASEGRSATIELEGDTPGTEVGAEVRVIVEGRGMDRIVAGGGSYLSASARSVYVPVGTAQVLERVEVRWRSGRVDVWENVPVKGVVRVKEGEGTAAAR